ncbi:MAG: hypothetical protein HYU64_13075 [Armatimonadetes bacterium]|nr:hypothetical protein [Armatimonadota bacterium]
MTDRPILLTYRFRKGDTLRYRITIDSLIESATAAFPPETIRMEMEIVQRSLGERGQGIVALSCTTQKARMTRAGESRNLPQGEMQLLLRRTGEVVESRGNLEGSRWGGGHPAFPERPVSLGEEWEGKSTVSNAESPDILVITRHRLEALESLGNYECARILAWSDSGPIQAESRQEFSIKISTVTHFAYKEGRMVRSVVQTQTLTRLSPEEQITTRSTMTCELV